MDKTDRQNLFNQYYLHKVINLNITKTSTYSKAEAFVKGCLRRKNLQLYKSQMYYLADLQTILNYDPESATIIFKQNKITFNEDKKLVLVQCRHCGKMTQVHEFCPKCEQIHYCSETCNFNSKISHEKEQCMIKMYPKLQHATLIEIHFGSNIGQNVQVYFQHQTRMSALIRGQQIIHNAYQYFTSGEGSGKVPGNYLVLLKDNHLQFNVKNQQQFAPGPKIEIESFEDIKRIYEDNAMLQALELYCWGLGGLLGHYSEQVHNNHIHLVYIFRIP